MGNFRSPDQHREAAPGSEAMKRGRNDCKWIRQPYEASSSKQVRGWSFFFFFWGGGVKFFFFVFVDHSFWVPSKNNFSSTFWVSLKVQVALRFEQMGVIFLSWMVVFLFGGLFVLFADFGAAVQNYGLHCSNELSGF